MLLPYPALTKTADEILDKVAAYCQRISDSRHYVMATTRQDTVVIRRSIDRPVHGLFPVCCGEGAHSPRIYD